MPRPCLVVLPCCHEGLRCSVLLVLESLQEIIQKALETHASIVDLLIAAGANQDLKDKKGNVAIDFDYKKKEEAAEGAEGKPTKERGDEL